MATETLPQTVWQDNANLAATRDRVSHTDMVIDVACKDAIGHFRNGRPDVALERLQGAGERAERTLGPTDWSSRCRSRS